jgi:hypothetical protein
MPKVPLFKRCLKENLSFDPRSLVLYKNDQTLQVEDLKCPFCKYPKSRFVSSDKDISGRIVVYHFCERKEPVCGFSWAS